MWAAIGSAVGLGSIWRFPYILGESGGGAFLIVFIICLLFVGFPVLISEIAIGRKVQSSPYGAFLTLGRSKVFGVLGKMTILTGFLVSTFYSVISGFTLGYLYESLMNRVTHFTNAEQASSYFNLLTGSPLWAIGFHTLFFGVTIWILYYGVQKGIESKNKIFMPLLFVMLILLALQSLRLPKAYEGISFLLSPDFSQITPSTIILALGQAFFGLSLGQGTMVTYGSYLSKDENLFKTCFPILCSVVVVSLLAGIAIFPMVFSAGLTPSSGPDLMFKTLPLVLSKMHYGYVFSIAFFFLVFIAALTSQISALEPSIAYLIDEKKWSREKSVLIVGAFAYLIGIPSALSFGVLRAISVHGFSFFDLMSNLCVNILIPLGGFFAVILVGWRWGLSHALQHIEEGAKDVFKKYPILEKYLIFSIKYIAPFLIGVVFMNLMGIL